MTNTRNAEEKPWRVRVNGNDVYIKAKTRTSAVSTALTNQSVEVTQLTASDVMSAGLRLEHFIVAPPPEPKPVKEQKPVKEPKPA